MIALDLLLAALRRSTGEISGGLLVGRVYSELRDMYERPDRAYHGWRHIITGLVLRKSFLLNAGLTEAEFACDEVIYAYLWHDCVYVPGRLDNESLSAEKCARDLELLGVPSQQIDKVTSLILDTAYHDKTRPRDSIASQVMTCIDLAPLGGPESQFLHQVRGLYTEYVTAGGYTDEEFRMGQIKFYLEMLQLPRIYSIDWFYDEFERSARRNMESAIIRHAEKKNFFLE